MTQQNKEIWIVSGVAVEYQGKFLITQQGKGRFHEGKWAIPGGMVEPELTILENAKREVLEEAGLEIEITGLLGISRQKLESREPTDPGGLLIYFLYYGLAKTDKVTIKEGEISDHKWLTLEELKSFPKDKFRPVMDFIIKKIEQNQKYPTDIVQG